MGKGSRRNRSSNRKKKSKQKKISNGPFFSKRASTNQGQNRNEIMTDILNMNPDPTPQPHSAILMPPFDDEPYETAHQCLLRLASEKVHQNPPLDALGRPRKDIQVTPQTGSIDKVDNPKTYTPANDPPDRKVILFRDHKLAFPELALKVCVLGPPEDTRGFPALFARALCEKANEPTEADLVVFTGGPDVDPAYYGKSPVASFYGSERRDAEDISHYLTCLYAGIPMLGICRGAQFLAAMNGYSLVQDMDNHNTDHQMYDKVHGTMIEKVSSRHHQAVIPGPGMDVIATAFKSTYKELAPDKMLRKEPNKGVLWPPDTEAFFIRDTCCIGIQGHPEYKGYNKFAQWSLEVIDEYVIMNEDVTWVDNFRRLRPEFVSERDSKFGNSNTAQVHRREILTLKQGEK